MSIWTGKIIVIIIIMILIITVMMILITIVILIMIMIVIVMIVIFLRNLRYKERQSIVLEVLFQWLKMRIDTLLANEIVINPRIVYLNKYSFHQIELESHPQSTHCHHLPLQNTSAQQRQPWPPHELRRTSASCWH